jgi:spore maturation protein CgeB
VTTDPFAVPKYRQIGVKNVFLSQWASLDHEVSYADNTEYKYDVSFVGGSHSVRRWFIKELRRRGVEVASFGYGWPSGPVTLPEMMSIFQTSKINLNLSNSITYDLRYLTNNIKNPLVALKSPKTASQIKARNFEIPFYGGFQMTDYVPTIEKYFKIGEEISCYRDVDEALLLIEHFLKNDEEREAVKKAGIARSRGEHSYFHRHSNIFKELK